MGIYHGEMENPCPRCGGKVLTTFISVSPMAFYIRCSGCNVEDFTEEEQIELGNNGPVTQRPE